MTKKNIVLTIGIILAICFSSLCAVLLAPISGYETNAEMMDNFSIMICINIMLILNIKMLLLNFDE